MNCPMISCSGVLVFSQSRFHRVSRRGGWPLLVEVSSILVMARLLSIHRYTPARLRPSERRVCVKFRMERVDRCIGRCHKIDFYLPVGGGVVVEGGVPRLLHRLVQLPGSGAVGLTRELRHGVATRAREDLADHRVSWPWPRRPDAAELDPKP